MSTATTAAELGMAMICDDEGSFDGFWIFVADLRRSGEVDMRVFPGIGTDAMLARLAASSRN